MATKKKASPQKTPAGKVTYHLELKNGEARRVTVPATWRLTFGPTTPYERKNGGGYNDVYALRFYDGDRTNLKAIFTDVRSFRALGEIVITEKRIQKQRKTVAAAGRNGGKDVVVEATMEEWLDPDSPEAATPNHNTLRLTKQDVEDLDVSF